MDFSAFSSAFLLLLLAEMGDKSQFMTLALAHRYPPRLVLAGAFTAFFTLNLLAIGLGTALFRYLPQGPVLLTAGALFLFFAWRMWREASEDSAEEPGLGVLRGALFTSFSLIFVAELGDKTQLALVALAASSGAPWSVFSGGTLALWTVAALAVLLGSTLLRRLSPAIMHRAAAALFLIFGLIALGRGLHQLGG